MAMVLIFTLCVSNTGVVIVDNVWFYGDDHKMQVLNTGDIVEIIERLNDMIKVKYNQAIGKMHKDVLIDFNKPISEEKLFVFARGYFDEREYKHAAKLFDIFIRYFDKSIYFADALYYCGLSYEEIARKFETSDTLKGVILNERSNQWYYSGDVYKTILEKFSKSTYASKSAYHLIKIFRIKNLPWKDSVQLIQRELKMWQEFISKYKTSEEYVLALLEIGYLNRVLFQITKDLIYKKDAIKVFQKIIDKYPNTVHSAQAEVHLYEIEKGEIIFY